MTRHEQLTENYEDALFELLMEGVIERESGKIEEEYEQLKSEPGFSVPPELDRSCLAAIKKACRKRRNRYVGKKVYGAFSKIAVIILVILVLFSSAYAAFPAVRVGVLNLVIEVSEIATTLWMDDPQTAVPENEGSAALVHYSYSGIPDEFSLVSSSETSFSSCDYYENSSKKYIEFSTVSAQGTLLNVNTENADSVEELTVSGFKSLLVDRGDLLILTLADTDAGMFITLFTDALSKAELLAIADTIEYA